MTLIPRIAALIAAAALSFHAQATTPPEATMDENNTTVSATGGPHVGSNVTGTAGDPVCDPATCDEFLINIGFDPGFVSANPNFQISINVAWDMAADDIDVYVYNDQDVIVANAAASVPRTRGRRNSSSDLLPGLGGGADESGSGRDGSVSPMLAALDSVIVKIRMNDHTHQFTWSTSKPMTLSKVHSIVWNEYGKRATAIQVCVKSRSVGQHNALSCVCLA